MPVTRDAVKEALDPEEPDYEKAAQEFGPEALPHLEAFVEGEDYMLASKAAYLAGLIDTPKAQRVLEKAARSSSSPVRVATAAVVTNLKSPGAEKIVVSLLGDLDVGVRRVALESIRDAKSAEVLKQIGRISRDDPDRELRHLAVRILSLVREPRSPQ